MEKYGMLVDGKLLKSESQLEGYKPIVYAPIPLFDQLTQYVVQTDPIDNGDHIFVGVEVKDMQLDEEMMPDGPI